MLALLPLLALVSWTLALRVARPSWGWGRSLVRASVLLGALAVLITEGLSLARVITTIGLSIAWAVVALVGLGWYLAQTRRTSAPPLPVLRLPRGWSARAVLIGVLLILALIGALAWIAPPNTWDALNYHMARVAHWAQDRSVAHYPTGVEIQNSRTPGAEYLVLHLYVLSGTDRWANLVSWCALVGSLIGVSLLARNLKDQGGSARAAVVYAATLPMAIVQASSTMNDLVLSFWLVVVALESFDVFRGEVEGATVASLSGAAGLALVTKPTAIAFLLPFTVADAVLLWKRRGVRSTAAAALVAVSIFSVLNAGYVARNLATYGAPADPVDVQRHRNENLDPRAVLSNLVRNAALHAGTPSPYVNKAIAVSLQWLHRLMGVDPNDPRTTTSGEFRIRRPALHEDWVGNPLHLLLALVGTGLLVARRKRVRWEMLAYAAAVVAGTVAFSALYKWLPFNSRLHTPGFMLYAPVVGGVLAISPARRWASGIGLTLILASLPWLLALDSRPWIAVDNGDGIESVLTEPRERLYFVNALYLETPYRDMSAEIEKASCRRVGIMLSGANIEYPLWALLGAPRHGLRLEWIVAGTPSARYSSPEFQPCAIICQDCPPDQEEIRRLPLRGTFGGDYGLYLATDE
ncbi:MAG: hypothetical protein AB1449_11910 [Chloroflexota bacterium]